MSSSEETYVCFCGPCDARKCCAEVDSDNKVTSSLGLLHLCDFTELVYQVASELYVQLEGKELYISFWLPFGMPTGLCV